MTELYGTDPLHFKKSVSFVYRSLATIQLLGLITNSALISPWRNDVKYSNLHPVTVPETSTQSLKGSCVFRITTTWKLDGAPLCSPLFSVITHVTPLIGPPVISWQESDEISHLHLSSFSVEPLPSPPTPDPR